MATRTTEVLCRVRPEWVDHYGHMNLAYYLVAFDLATDRLWPALNLGAPFRARGLGTFAAESWQAYLREVVRDAPLAAASAVLAFDAKRLLIRHRLHHAEEGWLAAENEVLYLCVDLATRRVVSWPEDVLARFAAARTDEAPRRLALTRPGR
ncbi:thioesterase [Elioraea sp. Yellowstone]|jgi:acyl-CoA thioester hydrolase|uniref:acyl-CoA thioesterase n=1 Tax=Elioraea sp. Yellowstone TaxID=2592070 RepID=UPI001150230D|nr:thioesterase family protein [Elioraea sp. Yellowstone]TQF84509.1 thioesterase [Elioraea sp. Yellowstone]